ncbi:M12 family metallo-peptidase [Streptomyces xanthochromogenes]|uniref:InlB B-repeat-containing protein n=1 Tax=Streptomyces xanthochromogenes TaxID=67384 RepID=UPI00341BAA7F
MNPPRRHRAFCLLVVCIAALTTLPLAAASSVSAAPATHGNASSVRDGKEVLRERTIRRQADMFTGLCTRAPFGAPREHTFVFFDDVQITAVQDGAEENNGTLTWSGHVKDRPDTSVIASLRGVCSSGHPHAPAAPAVEVVADLGARVYRLETLHGDSSRLHVTEEDPRRRPQPDPDDALTEAASSKAATRRGLQGRSLATPAEPVVIDVIAGYTRRAVSEAGSEQQVINTIDWAERKLNEAFADSGIPASIDIIGTYDTGYQGDNTSSALLGKVNNPQDRQLGAHAAALRRRYGADLVTIVNSIDPGQSSGQGDLPTQGSFNARDAFSVVDFRSLTGWYNLGHEIGHNLGMFHDRDTLDSQAPSHVWTNLLNTHSGTGWITPRGTFHTLMAYATSCTASCATVNQYSNTENTVDGQPLGDVDNNNAALARLSTPIVAGYRAPTVAKTRYALNLTATDGGTVRPAVYGPYKPGTTVGVTARPQRGFHLAAWIYDGVQYAPSPQVNFTMDRSHTLHGVFLPS